MSVSESERRDVYIGLETAIGPNAANSLMKLLPYQPADQLVTRADMHAHTTMLRGEMAELRSELRTDMTGLRVELKDDIQQLRNEFIELKVSMQRLMTGAIAANTVAVVTALVM